MAQEVKSEEIAEPFSMTVEEVLVRYAQVVLERDYLREVDAQRAAQSSALAGEVGRMKALLESHGIDPDSLPGNRAQRRASRRPAAGAQ